MARDPRVEAAVKHWAHRFVSNGIPLSDFQDVTGSLKSWDDWCSAWSACGAKHEDLGRAAQQGGRHLSAAQHLSTASVCYHFGKYLFVQDKVQMKAAHEKAVSCRTEALPYLDPPGERVEIPYDGTTLKGILRKPMAIDNPPVVLMAMGLDSAKEEMATNEQVFLERGLATLAFDGPGQGEAEYDLPICPEYEKPVGAVIDWLETKDDVDASRVGMWGVSLGGYYAPRAAAYEKRIKACIGLSGPYHWGDIWDQLPGLTRQTFQARSFCETEDEARAYANRLSLKEAASQITCPLYVVGGRLDEIVPPEHAERLAAEAKGPTILNLVEDGTHVVNNRIYKYRTQSADWIASNL